MVASRMKNSADRAFQLARTVGKQLWGSLHGVGVSCPPTSTARVLAPLLGEKNLTVIDIGARGGAEDAWWRIPELASIVGFEPEPDECARLNREAGRDQRFVPLALGSTRRRAKLYVAEYPGNSSLFPPIEELAVRYAHLRSGYRTVAVRELDLIPLDEWARQEGGHDVAFIKLDTQGTELDILMGAEATLATCQGLEVEVEFDALYQGQPTFPDVDRFLTQRGFRLWRITEMTHYGEDLLGGATRWDRQNYGGLAVPCLQGSGRLFFGNAIYFRDHYGCERSEANARKLAITAALLGGLGDLAGTRAYLRTLVEWNAPGLAMGAGAALRAHHDELEACSRSSSESLAASGRPPVRLLADLWHRRGG